MGGGVAVSAVFRRTPSLYDTRPCATEWACCQYRISETCPEIFVQAMRSFETPYSVAVSFISPRLHCLIIIIILYIYHALINALSAHVIHINLNMIFYTHVEHSLLSYHQTRQWNM